MKNYTVLEVGGRRTQVYLPIQGAPLHNFKDYDHLTTTELFFNPGGYKGGRRTRGVNEFHITSTVSDGSPTTPYCERNGRLNTNI